MIDGAGRLNNRLHRGAAAYAAKLLLCYLVALGCSERTRSARRASVSEGWWRSATPDELPQMVREMQRRGAALEGRIDELVDARDRLERQVAAQTEELRVQRAAIARTQRAVRNLARPEDAGDDEPTEPALRDPN